MNIAISCAHVEHAPKIDEDDNEVVTQFIDKYILYSLPNADQYSELNAVVKQVQIHHHTATCQEKLGVTCRFNAPWPPSTKTCTRKWSAKTLN